MTYPDMGAWSYAYDTAGNLTRQTDAKSQTTCLYYDGLNRLKGKTYRGDTNCPGDPGYGSYTVKNYYDRDENNTAVANGLGRRTVLMDGSGNTRWLYDLRGRVTQETRVISGASGGTFVTRWDYDSADRVKWQKYPADNTGQVGEQVNYGYNAAGGLTSVAGQATYVSSTTYDAAGRPDVRTLGSGLATDYDYYPWTQAGGRLARLQTGALQDLRYGYDAVGNVTRIEDYKAGAPEVQSFGYDSLDRLIGVSGAYTETYAYTPPTAT